MNRVSSRAGRVVWLIGLSILLLGRVAAAGEPPVFADFDGDGQRDTATLERGQPSTLRVWLSTTGDVAVVASATPIQRILARDLDGDRRAELIAGGARRLQVWTNRARGFARVRPHRHQSSGLSSPVRRRINPTAPTLLVAAPPPTGADLAPAPDSRPRAPARGRTHPAPVQAGDLSGRQLLAPLAPRPPPTAR